MPLVLDRPILGDGLFESLVKLYGNKSKVDKGIADAIYLIRLLDSNMLLPTFKFGDYLEREYPDKGITITLMWIILKTQVLPNDEFEHFGDEVEEYIHKSGIGEHYLTECKRIVWKWMKNWRLGYNQLMQEYQKLQSEENQKTVGQEYVRKMFKRYMCRSKSWGQTRREKEYDRLEVFLKLAEVPDDVKEMIEALQEDRSGDSVINVQGNATINDIHNNNTVNTK